MHGAERGPRLEDCAGKMFDWALTIVNWRSFCGRRRQRRG